MPLTLELPYGIIINLSFWYWLFSLPTNQMIAVIFAMVGWAIVGLVFVFMIKELWVNYRQNKYTATWKWMLLAVDIPLEFIQTHKAVEQVFAHLSGALSGINIGQKFWIGKKQKWFSLEIISLEGYIQFLIRTESEYRDLVEASIYAQYPEAEITEVEDYANSLPTVYPNQTHDMVGIEFKMDQNEAYPIRTYQEFEYAVSKDVTQSDPIAAVLENFTRIGKGENLLFQIVIEPTSSKWKEKGIELVKELVAGKPKAPPSSLLSFFGEMLNSLGRDLLNVWNWDFTPLDAKDVKAKEPLPGKVSDLTPGKRGVIEAIENKISKIGFKSKARVMYVAKKEVFNPGSCLGGFVGSLNQFHTLNRNGIVPYLDTEIHYFFVNLRTGWIKTKFASAFKKRKLKTFNSPYILNIEELATLWHFPLPFVKTPLLQHTSAKRAEPPLNLPIELPFAEEELAPPPPPPPELPYA